jgi:hypothetical protein
MNYPRIITALVARTNFIDCCGHRRCRKCFSLLGRGHEIGCSVRQRATRIVYRQLRESARPLTVDVY